MADLLRVKNNVSKMVSMGAPESDIDQYISSEGTNVDQVKNFRVPPTLPERAKIAMTYGLPAAAAGARSEDISKDIKNGLSEQAPNIYQGAGNIIGAGAGAIATLPTGGVVNPESGAAMGGAIGRGGYEAYRQFLNKEPFSLPKVKNEFQSGLTGEIIGSGMVKGLEKAIPAGKNIARRIMQSMLKPTLKQLEDNPELMDTALKAGYGGTKHNMYDKTIQRIKDLGMQVKSIIEQNKELKGNPENAISEMEKLAKNYEDSVDSKSAQFVRDLKDEYVNKLGLKKPVYGEVENGQFVMGPASKQTTPQMKETYGSKIKGPLKDLKGRSTRDIFTPSKSVENPEDVVAMNIPKQGARNQKIVSISPKETYEIRPKTFGPPMKTREIVGEELNPQSVVDMQANKERAYRLLESKRSGGGYGAETTSPEISGRQAFARGTRIDQESVLPEVGPLNKEASKLIPLSEALGRRIDIAGNRNLEGLGDMLYDVPALMEPTTALPAIAVGRRILGTDTVRNGIANKLYNLESDPFVSTVKNKYGTALANAFISQMSSKKN